MYSKTFSYLGDSGISLSSRSREREKSLKFVQTPDSVSADYCLEKEQEVVLQPSGIVKFFLVDG